MHTHQHLQAAEHYTAACTAVLEALYKQICPSVTTLDLCQAQPSLKQDGTADSCWAKGVLPANQQDSTSTIKKFRTSMVGERIQAASVLIQTNHLHCIVEAPDRPPTANRSVCILLALKDLMYISRTCLTPLCAKLPAQTRNCSARPHLMPSLPCHSGKAFSKAQ